MPEDEEATMAIGYAHQGQELDLRAIEAHLEGTGPYTYDDARDDVRALISAVRRLEEQRAAVAHLINLAILHGASPLAIDRLRDALHELGGPD